MHNVSLLFSLGPTEMILLVIAAIFIFGPKRLPEIGQALGDTLRSFRSASNGEAKTKGLPPSEGE